MRCLHFSKPLKMSLAITLVAICAGTIFAQSGRRSRKTASPPATVPTPEAIPAPTPVPKPEPTFTFIVSMEKFSDFTRIPLNTYSGVLRSCADRLDDSSVVKADTTSQEMSRGDAIRQAKSEKSTYVVWLQLKTNNLYGRPEIGDDPNDVYVQYVVLAPTTAKLVTSGSIYPETYRNSRIRVPTPNTQGDYYLNQAARGAAERILDHFHLHLTNRAAAV
jgi:hypothetical protein